MAKVLIIDDEQSIRRSLKEILEYEHFETNEAPDGASALELIKSNPYDVILCDIKMPRMDGIEVLHSISQIAPDTPVVMISGHGTIETAVESLKKGAFDYIQKPLDLNRLLVSVRNALDRNKLVQETKTLRRQVSKGKEVDMIGESPEIMKIKEMIDKVAPTDARVLIMGENGTGKELVARQLHKNSNRSPYPFVEVNCAAIPSELIESELFGHEKGSFTSAIKQRIGKFEQAERGTLFLDEIGDMSLEAQSKVLRALQENKITRVGGDKDIHVNVRVIAATNKDLKKEIKTHLFREDLFHRLSVIIIHVPSLNKRKDDISILANHFMKIICDDHSMPLKVLTEDAIKELEKIHWTGNIRELRNIVERLVILCGETINAQDVLNYVKF